MKNIFIWLASLLKTKLLLATCILALAPTISSFASSITICPYLTHDCFLGYVGRYPSTAWIAFSTPRGELGDLGWGRTDPDQPCATIDTTGMRPGSTIVITITPDVIDEYPEVVRRTLIPPPDRDRETGVYIPNQCIYEDETGF